MTQSVQNHYKDAVAAGQLRPDPAQEQAAFRLDQLYHQIVTSETPLAWMVWRPRHVVRDKQGVYLYGPVGRGKSMLMQFFIDAVQQWNGSVPAKRRQRIERHHFHAFMLDLHKQLFALKARPDEMDNHVARLADHLTKRVDILCFDEFHVTDVADAMLLMPFFTRALANGLTLVATSNFAPLDLYQNGLQRGRFVPFIALLQDKLNIVSVAGEQDYRLLRWQNRTNQQDHWLSPLDAATDIAFNDLFRDLIGYDDIQAMDIEVPGQQRTVHIAEASTHVAKLPVDRFLQGNVGAADFLTLAQQFKILLLDQIMPFAANENDRAKRFMLLIDTVYEAGTHIYGRAACEPDQLYPNTGKLAFEFARTVSRLQEMRYKKI